MVKAKTSWGVKINLEINKVRGGKERKKKLKRNNTKEKEGTQSNKKKKKVYNCPFEKFFALVKEALITTTEINKIISLFNLKSLRSCR